jgi:hypothetical protein
MRASKKIETSIETELENARIGYQVAIGLVTDLNSAIWSIFNAMLVAHSIVVAGLTLILTSQFSSSAFRTILSMVGLILCLVWFVTVKRHRDYRAYYLMTAREIEEQYFGRIVTTLSRGGEFANGKPTTLKIGGKKYVTRLSFWSRLANAESASNLIIIIFAVIYVGLFFV